MVGGHCVTNVFWPRQGLLCATWINTVIIRHGCFLQWTVCTARACCDEEAQLQVKKGRIQYQSTQSDHIRQWWCVSYTVLSNLLILLLMPQLRAWWTKPLPNIPPPVLDCIWKHRTNMHKHEGGWLNTMLSSLTLLFPVINTTVASVVDKATDLHSASLTRLHLTRPHGALTRVVHEPSAFPLSPG